MVAISKFVPHGFGLAFLFPCFGFFAFQFDQHLSVSIRRSDFRDADYVSDRLDRCN